MVLGDWEGKRKPSVPIQSMTQTWSTERQLSLLGTSIFFPFSFFIEA